MERGERLLMVTDGITEAENHEFEFFGDVRLEKMSIEKSPIDKIIAAVQEHRQAPLADDVTLLELEYKGQ
jgi:serine phosphatase RsbU (regulator of sigma subunit)